MSYKSYSYLVLICAVLFCCVLNVIAAPIQDLEELSLNESIQIVVNNATQQKMRNIPELVFRTHKAYHTLDKLQSLINVHKDYSKGLNNHYTSINELYKKGLLGKVDLLAVKARLANAELSLLELKEEYKREEIAFNTLLNRISNTPIGTKPIPNVVKKYSSFEGWLRDIGNSIEKQSHTITARFNDLPEAKKASLYSLYETVIDKKSQITLCENIIDRSEKIIGLQTIRFKNSLTTSNAVLASLLSLLDAQKKYIALLYSYHTAMAQSEFKIKEIII